MSYPELIKAAHKADQAGDTAAAQEILRTAMEGERNRITAGGMPRVDGPAVFQGDPPRGDRFGDTIRDATRGPAEATSTFAARTVAPDRTPLQRAGDAGMTALNALGTGYAFGAGLVGELVGGSPTGERQLARDLMMMGAVAVPELAGVSSTARLAGQAGRAAQADIPAPRDRIEAGKRAADDLGITPSLGAGGKVRSMTAATLEKVPLTGDLIAKDATRFIDAIADTAAASKARVGTAAVPSEAGATLQSGLLRYVERGEERAERLFDAVSENIPNDTTLTLTNARAAIDDIKKPFQNNPELASKLKLNEWDVVLQEAETNGIPWAAVRQLRSDIGKALKNDGGALGDESKSRLKRLYGALSEDMAQAARTAGPDAEKAWRTANEYYRQFATRVERNLDKTISAQSPERAFEAFANMAREGASTSDITRMRQIKASLKPSEWRDVSASIVDRLGRPTPGQLGADGSGFSAAKFLTDWNRLSPQARNLLLPDSVRQELQKLADVAEMARNANAERNFSNTGNIVTGAMVGSGATVAPGTTALLMGGTWGSAKAMTSPIFLRALNRAARGDRKQIEAMAGGRGPFAEDARTVLQITAAETAATANANSTPRTASGF